MTWNVSVSFVIQLRKSCKSYLNFEAECEAASFPPFCMNHSSEAFSLAELKGARRIVWLRSVEGIMSGISCIISACMCVWPSLPSTSAAKTHYSMHLWLALKCSVLPWVKEVSLCFNQQLLSCKIPSTSLCCWRNCTSQVIHFLNCLLPVSMTPHPTCFK